MPSYYELGGLVLSAAINRLTFFYDGKKVGAVTNPLVPMKPMLIIMSMGVPSEWTAQTPSSMKVAYVRVWQH